MKWTKSSEQALLNGLCTEFSTLTGQQKLEMMLTAPDVYFAVARLVQFHQAVKRIEEKAHDEAR